MNIVLLTTETVHHAYFARELRDRFGLRGIMLERRRATAPFPTLHDFEERRDQYERDVMGEGRAITCAAVCETWEFASVNDADAVRTLRAAKPDVILLFGTGRVSGEVHRSASLACLNFHGGNPEEYRGLDTHLWAIYHDDFRNLVTTLHHVDDEIDTGAVAFQQALALDRSTELHELRTINTRACVDMALLAANGLSADGVVPSRPQRQRGRYYSFMPAVLKQQCVEKLRHHVAAL